MEGPSRADLARIRSELARSKRQPEVLRSVGIDRPAAPALQAPVDLRNVRPLSRREARAAWRREHYVADQAIRVATILGVALASITVAIGTLILIGYWIAGKVSTAGATPGLVIALLIAGVIAWAFRSGTRSSAPRGHDGYGFHYGRCDHERRYERP